MITIATTRNGKETVYGKNGKLSVKNGQLVNEKGEPCMLRGISTHNLNTYPEYATKENMQFMTDSWGMEIFRLAMYTAEADDCKGYSDGSEEHRAELEALIGSCIEAAAELGIYVLVDWHILFDADPNTNKEWAIRFFHTITKKYGEYGNIIYEICNEPNLDTTWEQVKSYAEEVIPVIRTNVPDSVIVVGTPKWSQDVDIAAQNPLTYPNLLYTVHFYAATHTQWLRDKAEAAREAGLAVFVTEYGICDASGNGVIDEEETRRWTEYMKENHISHCLWNLSNKDESSAMIAPECKKTTGFTEEDLSPCGKWFVNYMSK